MGLHSKYMENTSKVLFEDDTRPRWYIALGDRWIGPLAAADVYEKILAAEITWAHFVWTPGDTEWRRICDAPTFQAAVPGQPARGVQKEVKEAATSPAVRKAPRGRPAGLAGEPRREWYLYYNDSQFGPFSAEDLSRFLKVGKIHGRVHAWKDGMDNWDRLERIEQFGTEVVLSSVARKKRKDKTVTDRGGRFAGLREREKRAAEATAVAAREQRSAPRRPLVARILLANAESVIVAVCRDISVGGMQVLTDRIPGATGMKLRMNVSPAGGGRGGRIRPFVAEGVIVRILEDGLGFSFRFERLPDDARRAIEGYIST